MENAQYASVECKDLAWRTHLLRSIRGHKDVKEAYRLTALGGGGGGWWWNRYVVHRSRKKEGGYTNKRREGNIHHSICSQLKMVIYSVPHIYATNLPAFTYGCCSGRCDHAGGWVRCQGGYLLHLVGVVCGQRGEIHEECMWYTRVKWGFAIQGDCTSIQECCITLQV